MKHLSPLLLTVVLLALLPLVIVAAVALGSEALGWSAVWNVLAHRVGLDVAPPDETTALIVTQLRLPRVLLAFLVGGGLSIIGVGMQALVRNPLAEPYILGISSGASAGASLFYLGFLPPLLSKTLSMPLAAFLGGLASLSIVYLVARTGSRVSVARLLLAGVAMSALMAAITSFITFASPDPNKLRAVLFWLLGSLAGTRWAMLPLPAIVTAGGLLVTWALARPLDALLIGEESAQSLGVPVEITKRLLIVLAALVTGTLVATAGAIGFVGLIIPHAVRSVIGVAHRRVVPLSFLAGGLFLIAADLVARTLLRAELPVGVVTALCGVPFFLFLLRHSEYRFG